MTLEIVVELESSCETVRRARVRQKHTMTTAGAAKLSATFSLSSLSQTHPDIEVDFFDDTAAVVQVQAQLVQAQAFL